jgi:hypothetical protein
VTDPLSTEALVERLREIAWRAADGRRVAPCGPDGGNPIEWLAAERLTALQARAEAAERDVARLDFLESVTMGPISRGRGFSASRDYEGQTDSPLYGDLPTVTFFTVPSQHVKGLGVRGAIDAAIAKGAP